MYGVDQCRVCGTEIRMRSPKQRANQEIANRHCAVSEKEWRARGFLCPPTRYQLEKNPADGCCYTCGRVLLRKRYRWALRIVLMVCLVAVIFVIVTKLLNYMRQ